MSYLRRWNGSSWEYVDAKNADTANSAVNADNVTGTYKGNDIDTDGDGKVNSAMQADNAVNADNLGGLSASVYAPRVVSAGDNTILYQYEKNDIPTNTSVNINLGKFRLKGKVRIKVWMPDGSESNRLQVFGTGGSVHYPLPPFYAYRDIDIALGDNLSVRFRTGPGIPFPKTFDFKAQVCISQPPLLS